MGDRPVKQLAVKAAHAGMRWVGAAPEMRAARRLRASAGTLPEPAADAARVMIVSPRDWAAHAQLEAVVGQALRARGARVRMVTCGGGLENCCRVNITEGPSMPCATCSRYTWFSARAHGLDAHRLDFTDDGVWPELDAMGIDELAAAEADGFRFGELVRVPVRWYLLRGTLEDNEEARVVLRAILRSARRIARAVGAAIDEFRPDVVFQLNGLFLYDAVTRACCERRAIRVVSYERGFTYPSWFVSDDRPAVRYDVGGAWDAWKDLPLLVNEEAALDEVLARRRRGATETARYQAYWREGAASQRLGGTGRRGSLAALFTNITWDSAVIGRERSFASMADWLTRTIEYFSARPQHRLVVRVHPAEFALRGSPTREPVEAALRARGVELPSNVALVGAADAIDSYELMSACDVGLVLTSTTGLEMALMGKPVVVAGEVHFGGRGFTLDAHDADGYATMLDGVLDDPAAHRPDVSLARRYAHLFLVRAPVLVPFVTEPVPGLAHLACRSIDELRPGCVADVDRLCDAVLGAAPVVPVPAGHG